jgi:hypothetical protein
MIPSPFKIVIKFAQIPPEIFASQRYVQFLTMLQVLIRMDAEGRNLHSSTVFMHQQLHIKGSEQSRKYF